MYLTGVEHEESGELLEAIKYYKRAIHLSPDVEQRIYMKPYEAKGLFVASVIQFYVILLNPIFI